ncbi:MAG: signal peptidase I [Candidatus Sumerlaeia bacterium]|nr:signal peptidase I [Candidatus Sumerlaeia bacterium]
MTADSLLEILMTPIGNDNTQARRSGVGPVRIALGAVVLVPLFLTFGLFLTGEMRAMQVVSASMSPTLEVGDRVLLRGIGRTPPLRGWLVSLVSPVDNGPELVKRLVAVPGDTVEIDRGRLYVNDREVPAPGGYFDPRSRVPRFELLPDQYYVIGDNRAQSEDSEEFGPVPLAAITGRVSFRYSPWKRRGAVE